MSSNRSKQPSQSDSYPFVAASRASVPLAQPKESGQLTDTTLAAGGRRAKRLPRRATWQRRLRGLVAAGLVIGVGWAVWSVGQRLQQNEWGRSPDLPTWAYDELPVPLAMDGGDPYIRALMRTISASESHDPEPYSLIYGGDRAEGWDEHPDRCVPIVAGPNTGNCTTAAGRYQFITTTWLDQAQRYHPNPSGWWHWRTYSFTPEAQDKIVYRWLNDPAAWNADLGDLLRQGQIEEVLYLLSPTWTSLGYGVETNSMSNSLPWIYEELLQDELANAEK